MPQTLDDLGLRKIADAAIPSRRAQNLAAVVAQPDLDLPDGDPGDRDPRSRAVEGKASSRSPAACRVVASALLPPRPSPSPAAPATARWRSRTRPKPRGPSPCSVPCASRSRPAAGSRSRPGGCARERRPHRSSLACPACPPGGPPAPLSQANGPPCFDHVDTDRNCCHDFFQGLEKVLTGRERRPET